MGELEGEPGWTEVHPFPFMAARRAFTADDPAADRLAIRYFRRPDGALAARVRFGPRSEGAPGHVHGGGLLAALDEAMGAAAWLAGHPVMTVRLLAEFRLPVPVLATLRVETELRPARGRVVEIRGRLLDAHGRRCVEGSGVFLRLTPRQLRDIFGVGGESPLPSPPAP